MAVRKTPKTGRPDHTQPIVGGEGDVVEQDPETGKMTTRAVASDQADIGIEPDTNLGDGDFVIPRDVDGLDSPPNIGGATDILLGVESIDANGNETTDEFSITVEYVNKDESTVYFKVDKTDSSKLQADDVLADIRPVRDYVKITVSSEETGDHFIRGGLNAQ